MSDFEVRGTEAFQQLGKTLKRASNGQELRKELLRTLRLAGKPTVDAVKSNLASGLPKKGGLAKDMSRAKVAVRNKLSGDSAGISVLTSVKGHDLPKVDQGILRHPTFGHGPWVNQKVKPNLVTDAVENQKPKFQAAILDAIESTLDQIVKEA